MGLKIRPGMSGRRISHAQRSGGRRRTSVVLAVGFALAMLGAALPSALAGPFGTSQRGTAYVGAAVGNNTGCGSPGYTSIQAAVDAAPNGGTVYLCGRDAYAEPVVISNKRLTLTGDRGATIQAPAVWPDQTESLPGELTQNGVAHPWAIVLVWGSNANATIQGLTINGPFTNGCGQNFYGILVIGGATATISDDQVTNIQDADPGSRGCQAGVAIEIGRNYWPGIENAGFVGRATIANTTVTGYQKNGVTVDAPNSSVTITNSTITGAGRISYTAQNGIQISRGATGEIRGNRISDNAYTGDSTTATGILVYGGYGGPLVTNVQITANQLTNNDVGVSLSDYNADGTGSPSTPTRNQVVGNMISNSAISNGVYQAGISDMGNQDTIMLNVISGIGYTGSANGVDVETIDVSEAIAPRVFMNIVR